MVKKTAQSYITFNENTHTNRAFQHGDWLFVALRRKGIIPLEATHTLPPPSVPRAKQDTQGIMD